MCLSSLPNYIIVKNKLSEPDFKVHTDTKRILQVQHCQDLKIQSTSQAGQFQNISEIIVF